MRKISVAAWILVLAATSAARAQQTLAPADGPRHVLIADAGARATIVLPEKPDELETYATDPNKADTDDDGLDDGQELNITLTDPLVADSDGDGLTDGEEVDTYSTDPNEYDTDGGGASDGAEVLVYGTNPNDPSDDIAPDADDDGLSDADEAIYGTDPDNPDSDGDGLSDGEEVHTYGTDPDDRDSDDDGLTDGEEINTYGSDPAVVDTDGDGLTDGAEANVYGTDPTLSDTDGGGVDDKTELDSGMDPLDASDDAPPAEDTGDTGAVPLDTATPDTGDAKFTDDGQFQGGAWACSSATTSKGSYAGGLWAMLLAGLVLVTRRRQR